MKATHVTPLLLLALTLAAALTSCNRSDREADATLDRADTLMDARPDSALAVVSSIQPEGLSPAVDSGAGSCWSKPP